MHPRVSRRERLLTALGASAYCCTCQVKRKVPSDWKADDHTALERLREGGNNDQTEEQNDRTEEQT